MIQDQLTTSTSQLKYGVWGDLVINYGENHLITLPSAPTVAFFLLVMMVMFGLALYPFVNMLVSKLVMSLVKRMTKS